MRLTNPTFPTSVEGVEIPSFVEFNNENDHSFVVSDSDTKNHSEFSDSTSNEPPKISDDGENFIKI